MCFSHPPQIFHLSQAYFLSIYFSSLTFKSIINYPHVFVCFNALLLFTHSPTCSQVSQSPLWIITIINDSCTFILTRPVSIPSKISAPDPPSPFETMTPSLRLRDGGAKATDKCVFPKYTVFAHICKNLTGDRSAPSVRAWAGPLSIKSLRLHNQL